MAADLPLCLDALMATMRTAWPEHGAAIDRRLAQMDTPDRDFAERVAAMIADIAGSNLAEYCQDYRWMCSQIAEEELHFRRTGEYRLNNFADACRLIYDNGPYMARYMNGLLVSQVLWGNHTAVLRYFHDSYITALPPGSRHLEIGPGHGLLLHMANASTGIAQVCGWDVSESSLSATRHCLNRLGGGDSITLAKFNLVENMTPERFDSITLSEVLEHVEDPLLLLRKAVALLSPRGQVFINMPVNSPAPDHIYLLREPAQVIELARQAGLNVTGHLFAPAAGYDLERARKRQVTVSCAVIGCKAEA